MAATYPSTFLQQYPNKIAFLIDCTTGLNPFALSGQFLDHFPPNSDVFFFYYKDDSRIYRRLKRIVSNKHGVYLFPTSANGITVNLSFVLGQIQEKYTDFILISAQLAAYADLCQHLIANNARLEHHIQIRSFGRLHEFEQFLQEMTRVQDESEEEPVNEHGNRVVHYSKEQLFNPCPYESREQSSNLYRFGELLHHLDTEHEELKYHYCNECQALISEQNVEQVDLLSKHIEEQHWNNDSGFELLIRSA